METRMKNLIGELTTKINNDDNCKINLAELVEKHGLKINISNMNYIWCHIKFITKQKEI